MTNAETIGAAIERLEEVRNVPVPKAIMSEFISWAKLGLGTARAANYIVCITSESGVDAQLAILRAGHSATTIRFLGETPGWAAEARALALPLARAILGDDASAEGTN